ncbi:MAG: Na+/H+ antiporter NhaA [Rhizomicrobium sp.]
MPSRSSSTPTICAPIAGGCATIIARLRRAVGERLAYVVRQYPNERAHPGAAFVARAAEAAARQGKFWEMHDALFEAEPPLKPDTVRAIAKRLGLDMAQFERDLDDPGVQARVDEDLEEGKRNGVTGTPSFFVDGLRYDGAWDYHSMLEELQRPVAAQLQRSARAFANLPASGGLMLLLAAAAALLCANSALAPVYHAIMAAPFGIGTPGSVLSLTVGEWCSEGLLAFFFLLVGLEIRREMTTGSLTDFRAAALPALCAVGGVLVPTAVYLALNQGPTAIGWSVPTATDIAFALGVLALLGTARAGRLAHLRRGAGRGRRHPVGADAGGVLSARFPDRLAGFRRRGDPGAVGAQPLPGLCDVALCGGGDGAVGGAARRRRARGAGRHLPRRLPADAAGAGGVAAAGPGRDRAGGAGPCRERGARGRRRREDRRGTGVGMGEPRPAGGERPAVVAGRPDRARGGAVERLSHPAAVRVLGDRGRAGARSFGAGLGPGAGGA